MACEPMTALWLVSTLGVWRSHDLCSLSFALKRLQRVHCYKNTMHTLSALFQFRPIAERAIPQCAGRLWTAGSLRASPWQRVDAQSHWLSTVLNCTSKAPTPWRVASATIARRSATELRSVKKSPSPIHRPPGSRNVRKSHRPSSDLYACTIYSCDIGSLAAGYPLLVESNPDTLQTSGINSLYITPLKN